MCLYLNFYIIFLYIHYVGATQSTLFRPHDRTKKCWSRERLALLRARRAFEDILPPSPKYCTGEYLVDTVDYLREAARRVRSSTTKQTRIIMMDALADTIGNYIRKDLMPCAKYGFYAGEISLEDIADLQKLYDEAKIHLDTQGYFWSKPAVKPLVPGVPIKRKSDEYDCSKLIIHRNFDKEWIPMPIFDCQDDPGALAFPYVQAPLRNIRSPSSAYAILDFYNLGSVCLNDTYKNKVKFEEDFCHWMFYDVKPHIFDENWYPAYGGVIQAFSAVKHACPEALGDFSILLSGDEKAVYKKNVISVKDVPIPCSCMETFFYIFVLLFLCFFCKRMFFTRRAVKRSCCGRRNTDSFFAQICHRSDDPSDAEGFYKIEKVVDMNNGREEKFAFPVTTERASIRSFNESTPVKVKSSVYKIGDVPLIDAKMTQFTPQKSRETIISRESETTTKSETTYIASSTSPTSRTKTASTLVDNARRRRIRVRSSSPAPSSSSSGSASSSYDEDDDGWAETWIAEVKNSKKDSASF